MGQVLDWWMEGWVVRRQLRSESTDLDERGLVPLDVARAILDEHTVYQSGMQSRNSTPLREGAYRSEQLIWPALLSFDHVEEFLARAEKIQWMEGPNSPLAPVLVERYGEAVTPWLLAHIVNGALVEVPRSITSNLFAIGSRAVFDALWMVRDLVDETTPDRNWVTRGYTPPEVGWVIRAADGPTPADPDRPVHKRVDVNLIIPWVRAHLDIGVSSLLEHHHAGSSRATEILRTILTSRFRSRISEADAVIEAAIGTKALKTLKKRPRVKLTAEAILAQLDGCWSGETPTTFASWPYFSTGMSRETDEYHALRMIAVRGSGAQWGLIFQRLAGVPLHPHEPAELQFFCYGSDCELGQDHGPPYRLVQVEDPGGAGIEGVVVMGRRGQLTLEDQMVEALDLRPGQSVEPHGAHHRANLVLRAYNTHFPDAVWWSQDPKYFVSDRVGFERGKVLFVAEAFAHAGARPDQPGAIRPSESPTFRSLAEAIATKKPPVFEPGVSNLDWRLHVTDSPDAGPAP